MNEVQNEQDLVDTEPGTVQRTVVWSRNENRKLPPFTQCHDQLNDVSFSLGIEGSHEHKNDEQAVMIVIDQTADHSDCRLGRARVLQSDRRPPKPHHRGEQPQECSGGSADYEDQDRRRHRG